MADEQRTYNNTGILFWNFRKKQPKHPDFQGSATVGGKKYKLAAWARKGKKGEFHSLAFTPDDGTHGLPQGDNNPPAPVQSAPPNESPDLADAARPSQFDDIPF